jgi:nitrite reductase/ring-hydroxylating ferredoxin subunit
MTFAKVAKVEDLKNGQSKAVEVGGKSIAVFNVDGKFYAIDQTCPHKGGPLAEGTVEEMTVQCPWHGAIFSLETGAGIAGPCGNGVHSYQTRVSGDDLEIDAGDS